jgi:hypothetical protein
VLNVMHTGGIPFDQIVVPSTSNSGFISVSAMKEDEILIKTGDESAQYRNQFAPEVLSPHFSSPEAVEMLKAYKDRTKQ